MRIVRAAELSVPISRYADPAIPSGGLTTSVAQSGLIRERFAPRLLAAGDLDPESAWDAMNRSFR
jgi:hypothetical protein